MRRSIATILLLLAAACGAGPTSPLATFPAPTKPHPVPVPFTQPHT